MFSSGLKPGTGPSRYSNMSSHARDYHNWDWDVADPNIIPPFDEMVARGSVNFGEIPGHDSKLAQNWMNWDNEYTAWRKAGLHVEVSLQFNPSMFPDSVFTNPYQSGYNYGFAFAKHFGSLNGTGDVLTFEVGNEPWGYADPTLYQKLLSGMAKGVKDADPTMRVLPGVFSSANDTLIHILPSHLQYLDALNIHAYSWLQTVRGTTGVHPEHNMSTLHEVNFMIRFRDANVPGLPVYLTEWGWDSAGAGETCAPPPQRAGQPDFPQCVSEVAQALYAVRGALVLSRKGLSRLTWYFYGNTVQTLQSWDQAGGGVFSRSGLSGSQNVSFADKLSLYALEQFVSTLGSYHFMDVIREDRDAFVYTLCDSSGKPSHVVAWRPVDASDTGTTVVTFNCLYSAVSATTLPAFKSLTGGSTALPLPAVSVGYVWSLQISGVPVIVTLGSLLSSNPSAAPSSTPTSLPTESPSAAPSVVPTSRPTPVPTALTAAPSRLPSAKPTSSPTKMPSSLPSRLPTKAPTRRPTNTPTYRPTANPTKEPTERPTRRPTNRPTSKPK